jgi:hypothetical protein
MLKAREMKKKWGIASEDVGYNFRAEKLFRAWIRLTRPGQKYRGRRKKYTR